MCIPDPWTSHFLVMYLELLEPLFSKSQVSFEIAFLPKLVSRGLITPTVHPWSQTVTEMGVPLVILFSFGFFCFVYEPCYRGSSRLYSHLLFDKEG